MTLQLTRELDDLIRARMETGLYRSPEVAVCTALELLSDAERVQPPPYPTVSSRDEILARVAESHRQLEAGEYVDFDSDSLARYFDALKRRAVSRLEARSDA